MSYSFWQDRSNGKSHDFDIVIVGGGIAGASCAYWLKKEDPTLNVAVLEKGSIGSGATGRNAGFITCGSVEHFNRLVEKHGPDEAHQIWRFSEINLELLKDEIIKGNAEAFGFEHKGTFSLASTDTEWSELKETAALMKKLAIGVEVIDENGVKDRLGAIEFVGGIKYLGDASVDPMALLKEIVARSGAKYVENCEVSRIEAGKSGNKKLLTVQGEFEAPIVVLATNGYSANLHPYFSDKIFPTRGQILVMEKVEPFMEAPCYANFVLDYFRQLPSGELLIGGFRQLEKSTEVGYSDHTTEIIQKALEEFVRKHLPKFKEKQISHRWAGVMGFSVDGQPMVGSLPNDNQIFFLGGFTAHGLGLAFHGGKCLADLMFDRQIAPFISAKRFN